MDFQNPSIAVFISIDIINFNVAGATMLTMVEAVAVIIRATIRSLKIFMITIDMPQTILQTELK